VHRATGLAFRKEDVTPETLDRPVGDEEAEAVAVNTDATHGVVAAPGNGRKVVGTGLDEIAFANQGFEMVAQRITVEVHLTEQLPEGGSSMWKFLDMIE